jgi:ribosomal protein S18 acetylase RimI-like enzyme
MTARAARHVPGSRIATREIVVRRLEDARAIRRRLATAEAYAAYAMGYLDQRLFHLASFHEATLGERHALAMHSRGGLGPATLLLGDPRLVGTLLELHPGLRHALMTCEPEHVDVALQTHHLWRPQTMLRMKLDASAFQMPKPLPPLRRLTNTDAQELNALYALEGDGIWYSGRQVAQGVYYGAHIRGRLVAAAGTHITSQQQRVGVVGNVFTHPDYRGRGYGKAVTAAVTAHLMPSCGLIVLSVDPANRAARRLYEELGYREQARLVEAMATRRSPFSPLPLIRRTLGRWRSGERGTEVVQA